MNLTSFTDVDAKEESSMRDFLDANAIAHETIFNTLLAAGVIVNHYPLWAPEGADEDWLQTHDSEHKAIAQTLGINLPTDLDAVDFEQGGQAADWFNNHALHHNLIASTLGI